VGRVYDATCGRMFSAWYGLGMRLVDEMGLRETRREVLDGAHGRTLDIGTGTGANLRLYPPQVDELVLAEPDPHMIRILRRLIGEGGGDRTPELLQAPAESLPFEDSSFDCVTSTMVLCTAADPAAALAEVSRVLRPGGKLLFLEHVRSEDPGFARWQDRLDRIWCFLADGCHCNRDSIATIDASPLELRGFKRRPMPYAPMVVKPVVYGSAVSPA
jgi:SAM-dependent methyltransferase